MLLIKSLFDLVSIPTGCEYSIYHTNYHLCDRNQEQGEVPRISQEYEFGDIIISTPNMRYRYTMVPSAYEWCADLVEYIRSRVAEENKIIRVNLDKLKKFEGRWLEFPGLLVVERISEGEALYSEK